VRLLAVVVALAHFLLTLVQRECPGLDQGDEDYMIYIETVVPITTRVSRCQHVLNKRKLRSNCFLALASQRAQIPAEVE
jgi:hypothetical protein